MPGMDDNVMVMFEVGQARGRVERELEHVDGVWEAQALRSSQAPTPR